MSKFYFFIWVRWFLYVTLSSLFMALIGSILISLIIYVKQGMLAFSSEVQSALFAVFTFSFPLVWGITLLLSLFLGLKYIFNICINGYTLKLLTCLKEEGSEVIEDIGYGDLLKVWRKWFILMIWLVGSQMVLGVIITTLFGISNSLFDWFNIYILYLFIAFAGYLSFIIIASRCKRIKVSRC